MAPPRTKYPQLAQIADPTLRSILKLVFDKLGRVEGQALDIGTVSKALTAALDGGGQRITALADPTAPLDAVNLQTLQRYVDAAIEQAAHPIVSAGIPPHTQPPGPGPGPGPGPDPGPGWGPFTPPQAGTGDIRCDGLSLRYASDGTLYPWRGCSDFRLYQRYLDGDGTVAAVIANRVASGANLLRVLGMYSVSGFGVDFIPSAYSNYFTSLAPFAALLAASGLFLEFCVFADAQFILPGGVEQQQHFNDLVSAYAGVPNLFLELVNEYPQNGVNPLNFTRPVGILSSAGSGLSGGDPGLPPWDYVSYHTPRDDQWVRKSKDLQELRDELIYGVNVGLQRPCVADEPLGAGDVDIPGSRSTVVNDFYWYAATAQLMGAGATFHSTNGVNSEVFSATQQGCANAFFAALAAVDPAAQFWTYTRGPFSNCPIQHDDAWALRTFAKLDTHQALAVVIRPTGLWPGPIAQDGWTVVSTTGPVVNGFGTLITLSR